MTVKINADTSDGLKFVSDTSGTVDIQSNGTTKFTVGSTIDIQGNELVLDADADTSIHASTDDVIDVKVGGNDNVEINALGASRKLKVYKGGGDEVVIQSNAPDASGNMRKIELEGEQVLFSTGASSGTSTAERMRITSDGATIMKQTTSPATATLTVQTLTGTAIGIIAQSSSNSGTSDTFANYNASGSYVGGINCTSSGTAFPTSSDYRLKENVSYSFDATTRLKQLKPCRFNFKIDTDNTVDGFLAHEVSSIVPEAIFGQKDAMETYTDDDGDEQTRIKAQSIDQSKLVPLLVKTIQELEARITALES